MNQINHTETLIILIGLLAGIVTGFCLRKEIDDYIQRKFQESNRGE